MVKKIMVLWLCFISCSSFAMLRHSCPQAPATTSGDFCSGFKASGYCHCIEEGMDGAVCENMPQVYQLMMDNFHNSLAEACEFGESVEGGVPRQVCIDDWNCYRNGGANSDGGSCQSTGAAC
ncbi:MAG: hypothetical protein V4501_01115 [Pseudomonadota bacterium]